MESKHWVQSSLYTDCAGFGGTRPVMKVQVSLTIYQASCCYMAKHLPKLSRCGQAMLEN
jgi:hypothetical protein